MRIKVPCIVWVYVSNQVKSYTYGIVYPMCMFTLYVVQDAFGDLPLKLMWLLHEARNHANYKSYVKVCMCQVDETSNQLFV